MKRLIGLVATNGFIAVACSSTPQLPPPPPSTVPPTSPNPTASATPTPTSSDVIPTGSPTLSPSPTPTHAFAPFWEAWFEFNGQLFIGHRPVAGVDEVEDALRAMLRGPTKQEREAGVATEIPKGTHLLGVTLTSGLAVVNFNHAFERGRDVASLTMRLAQVVYTASQFPSVNGVKFQINGNFVRVFSGQGKSKAHVVTQANYDGLLPAILVQQPQVGQILRSPFTIAGSANVFGSKVNVQVLDPDGTVVTTTSTIAACGTGCRGTFLAQVSYFTEAKHGVVRFYETSPQDGSAIHVVVLPVRFAH